MSLTVEEWEQLSDEEKSDRLAEIPEELQSDDAVELKNRQAEIERLKKQALEARDEAEAEKVLMKEERKKIQEEREKLQSSQNPFQQESDRILTETGVSIDPKVLEYQSRQNIGAYQFLRSKEKVRKQEIKSLLKNLKEEDKQFSSEIEEELSDCDPLLPLPVNVLEEMTLKVKGKKYDEDIKRAEERAKEGIIRREILGEETTISKSAGNKGGSERTRVPTANQIKRAKQMGLSVTDVMDLDEKLKKKK